MRIAWLVLLAACGGAAKSAPVMTPAPAPSATPAREPEPTTVAVNDPAPPGGPKIVPDPCEGGELTPASTGGPPASGGGGVGHGSNIGTGGGNPCGGGSRSRGHGPVVHLGQHSTQGGLDKAIIRRYIKRNLQRIQYCYEKELLAHPGIKGTVSVAFEIGVDGLVSTSVGTGLDVVAACVADVIKSIEFPKPKTVTKVVYPFELSATD